MQINAYDFNVIIRFGFEYKKQKKISCVIYKTIDQIFNRLNLFKGYLNKFNKSK